MRYCLTTIGVLLACASTIWATPPQADGPTNNSVLLPTRPADEWVKGPNNIREPHDEWSIYGGVLLVQPVFDGNPAFLVNSAGITRQVDFSHHLNVAPDIWLSYVSERGWGVRGHWFQFDHSATTDYVAAPGETIVAMSPVGLGRTPLDGGVSAFSNLAVNVIDIQLTCNFGDAKWSHLLGIGGRYTHMSQDYHAVVANAGNYIEQSSSHNFNGAGVSLAIETKRRIGETGFAIYGQFDGAIVFGRTREADTAFSNGTPLQFEHSRTRVLPTAELEAGIEYEKNVGRAKAFLQAGFAGQVWWAGGNASNLNGIGFSTASSSNFGFVGLAVRAGVRY
jgi:hypothetical protein